MNDKATTGVFVCECGGRISDGLDVPALVADAGAWSNVGWASRGALWCSPAGLEQMCATISQRQLDRVVIAGCTPRTHDQLFRRALEGYVNPGLIAVTNLRDLCVRPHVADAAGTAAKARDQVAMAVAELTGRRPATQHTARITPHAVVIGGGIAGLTAALAISEAGFPVTLVERQSELGGAAKETLAERIAALRARENVHVYTGTDVCAVNGSVGNYLLTLTNGEVIQTGAVIVATGARTATPSIPPRAKHISFLLCDTGPEAAQTCSHTCCLAAVRRATDYKRQAPDAEIAILFRELYTAGGAYDELYWEAQQAGVRFVRYPAGSLPGELEAQITIFDELTATKIMFPCDWLIPISPVEADPDAERLAAMLRLPVDTRGFIPETRIRLRPVDRIEHGVYACGAAHFPCDTDRAVFQAYSAAARAIQHMQRGAITKWAPVAEIDAARCNGCGDCARVCPFSAVMLNNRGDPGVSKLAEIDPLLCTGCGNCVSACPVQATQVPAATDGQIEAQVRAACSGAEGSPRVLLFACEWSGYSAAEIAGVQGLAYPACTRLIRVNCTGRLQPGLLLKALEMGAAGVMVLGCEPGVCHYEQGNERAADVFERTRALGRLIGLERRLALKWIPADDGAAFARAVNDFVECNGRHGP